MFHFLHGDLGAIWSFEQCATLTRRSPGGSATFSKTETTNAPASGNVDQKAWEAEVRLIQEQHEKSLHAALQQACAALETAHEEERKIWCEERERERCRVSAEHLAERSRLEELLENARAVRVSMVRGHVFVLLRQSFSFHLAASLPSSDRRSHIALPSYTCL